MLQAFTRSSAMVEPEKGGKFRLLDGNVNGEFRELVRLDNYQVVWTYTVYTAGQTEIDPYCFFLDS